MKRIRTVSVSLTLAACLGVVTLQNAVAEVAIANRQPTRVLDVSLHEGGLLIGQVVNAQGQAKLGVPVSLRRQGRELARTKTDKQGRFAVKGLANGKFELATKNVHIPVRVWSKTTAPPNAALGALVVEGATVRGQYGPYTTTAASFNQVGAIAGAAGGAGAGAAGVGAGVAGAAGAAGAASLASPWVIGGVVATGFGVNEVIDAMDDDDAS